MGLGWTRVGCRKKITVRWGEMIRVFIRVGCLVKDEMPMVCWREVNHLP